MSQRHASGPIPPRGSGGGDGPPGDPHPRRTVALRADGAGSTIVEDPAKNKVLSTKGEYAWGGAASTAFWVDPTERITALFFTQLLPSSTHPIRPQLTQLVYQALVD